MASRTLSTITTALRLDNSAFKKGLGNSKKDVNKFGSSMKGLGTAIGGAFAVSRIINFTAEVSKLAGVAAGVARAFDRIRPSANFMRELQSATSGAVSELDLMRRAVMASNFKIPLEDLANLLKFATKRAQETGESVDYLVNSIVIGIGRKAPLILDNLGISAVSLRQKLENVGHSGATVGDVAKAIGEIAQEELGKMGDITETAAIKQERLNAAITDMKVEFGNAANVLINEFLPAITKAAEGAGEFVKWFKQGGERYQWNKSLEQSEENAADFVAGAKFQIGKSAPRHAEKDNTTERIAKLKLIAQYIEEANKKLTEFNKNEVTWAGYTQELVIKALEDWRVEVETGTGVVEDQGRSIVALQEVLKEYQKIYDESTDVRKMLELKSAIIELQEEIQKLKDIGKEHPDFLDVDHMKDITSEFNKLVQYAKDFHQEIAGAAEEWSYLYDNDEEVANQPEEWETLLDNMELTGKEAKKLGNAIGITLLSSFDELGASMVNAFNGADAGLQKLGEQVLKNLGNILIMAGINTGNWPLAIMGAVMQLGSGILSAGGFGGKTPTVAGNSYGGGEVNFTISGQNLVGVLGRNSTYYNQVT